MTKGLQSRRGQPYCGLGGLGKPSERRWNVTWLLEKRDLPESKEGIPGKRNCIGKGLELRKLRIIPGMIGNVEKFPHGWNVITE